MFCGGANLGSADSFISVTKKGDISKWIQKIPELRILADVDPVFITSTQGLKMGSRDWKRISDEIFKRLDSYDGFVITHDIEGIEYAAAAMTFAFKDLNKPVIFTGSYSIPNDLLDIKGIGNINFRANLINAIQVAKLDIAEVCLVFGNRIVKGVTAERNNDPTLNTFNTADEKYLGKIDFRIILSDCKKRGKEKTELQNSFEDKVELFKLYPQLPSSLLNLVLKEKLKGIVLEPSEEISLPEMDAKFLEEVAKQKRPVVLFSPGGDEIKADGILVVSNMTLQTTLVKLRWILARSSKTDEVYQQMKEDFRGEIIT